MTLYSMLKLIHGGVVNDNEHYHNMLLQNKYYIVPSVNVDGVAYIEDRYKELGKLEIKRTSMHNTSKGKCEDNYAGVDLNRNYGFMFG